MSEALVHSQAPVVAAKLKTGNQVVFTLTNLHPDIHLRSMRIFKVKGQVLRTTPDHVGPERSAVACVAQKLFQRSEATIFAEIGEANVGCRVFLAFGWKVPKVKSNTFWAAAFRLTEDVDFLNDDGSCLKLHEYFCANSKGGGSTVTLHLGDGYGSHPASIVSTCEATNEASYKVQLTVKRDQSCTSIPTLSIKESKVQVVLSNDKGEEGTSPQVPGAGVGASTERGKGEDIKSIPAGTHLDPTAVSIACIAQGSSVDDTSAKQTATGEESNAPVSTLGQATTADVADSGSSKPQSTCNDTGVVSAPNGAVADPSPKSPEHQEIKTTVGAPEQKSTEASSPEIQANVAVTPIAVSANICSSSTGNTMSDQTAASSGQMYTSSGMDSTYC